MGVVEVDSGATRASDDPREKTHTGRGRKERRSEGTGPLPNAPTWVIRRMVLEPGEATQWHTGHVPPFSQWSCRVRTLRSNTKIRVRSMRSMYIPVWRTGKRRRRASTGRSIPAPQRSRKWLPSTVQGRMSCPNPPATPERDRRSRHMRARGRHALTPCDPPGPHPFLVFFHFQHAPLLRAVQVGKRLTRCGKVAEIGDLAFEQCRKNSPTARRGFSHSS